MNSTAVIKNILNFELILNEMKALALMGAASFCEAQRRKRYSRQQETAPKNNHWFRNGPIYI
jgi:hypothetical protein